MDRQMNPIGQAEVEIPAKSLPVATKADVVVIGGGTSGYVAAVSAARAGAHTVLIERNGFLGGSATGTYNTNLSSSHDSDGNRIMGGVGWEVIERLAEAEGATIHYRKGTHTPAHIFPEVHKTVALEMVYEAGVELYLHTWVSDVLVEEGVIRGVVVHNKSGSQVILGKTFVDCSADADIAFRAGAPVEQLDIDESYITSLDLTICNINTNKFLYWAKENAESLGVKHLPENLEDNSGLKPLLTIPIKGPKEIQLADGTVVRQSRNLAVKLMIRRSVCRVQGHVEIDGTDVKQITWAEYEGRRQALKDYRYLKDHVPGFEDAFVIGQSPLGIRETRRIKGEYWITIDDVLSHARFPDVIGLNCRALDKHEKNDKFSIKMLEGNHDIPYRALIPQRIHNLLVAGRCISSDHESSSSLRGGGTCMITGSAAGIAAALASRGSGLVGDLDIKALQKAIKAQGGVLSTDLNRQVPEEFETA